MSAAIQRYGPRCLRYLFRPDMSWPPAASGHHMDHCVSPVRRAWPIAKTKPKHPLLIAMRQLLEMG